MDPPPCCDGPAPGRAPLLFAPAATLFAAAVGKSGADGAAVRFRPMEERWDELGLAGTPPTSYAVETHEWAAAVIANAERSTGLRRKRVASRCSPVSA